MAPLRVPGQGRASQPTRTLAGLALALVLAHGALAAEEAPSGDSVVDAVEDGIEPVETDTASPVAPREEIDEIIVTGVAAEPIVQDETVSTVAFDPRVLKLEGIKDLRDLGNFTPSLEIKSTFAASNPTIFIRGVGLDDFNANAQSAVAIYQDGVYMQSPAGQLFQFFDVESVEVARGPQGTLYRNAGAGAILVRSKKPTNELSGYFSTTFGNYDTVETEAAFGGPIVPDLLMYRLSASWGVRDGITKNRCSRRSGEPDASLLAPPCNQQRGNGIRAVEPGIDHWTNDADSFAARGQLLLDLPLGETTESEWLINVHGGQNRSRALQYQHRGVRFFPIDPAEPEVRIVRNLKAGDADNYRDRDGDAFSGDYNIDGPEEIDLFGTNLAGTLLFGNGLELRSLTAYEWHDRYTRENTDANPTLLLETIYEDDAWQISQDLVLSGPWLESDLGEGDWQLGLNYIQEELDVRNFYEIRFDNGSDLDQEYSQTTRAFAAYGLSDYRVGFDCGAFPCDFTLTTGVRFSLEDKEFDTSVCAVDNDCAAVTLSGSDSETWDGVSGEASLAWNYTDDSSVYVKYSRGFTGGHFNGGAVSQFDIITGVDPQLVDAFEGGLRSYWFDTRLMLNVTGFYYDYQDLQVFQLEQTPLGFPIAKLENANDATVYGIEVDLALQPLDGLNITYNFAWVDSEYGDFKVELPFRARLPTPRGQPPRIVDFLHTSDYSGNPLIGSPLFSMTGSIEYEWELPGGAGFGYLTPRLSFSWKDDVYYDAASGRGALLNFPKGTFGQDSFYVFNAALTWRSEGGRFELSGWVRNFMDEHYKTQSFDVSGTFRLLLDAYAEPRTTGVTATFNF